MDAIEIFRFCRVCLVPEETERFSSVFDDNGSIALKIHNLAGILIIDIDEKFPSLICHKCIEDIEAVEKLKMRILDADEYTSLMTMQREEEFLNVDMKEVMKDQSFKTPQSSKKKVRSKIPELVEIKIKQEPIDTENINPRKRKLETNYDSFGNENLNTSEQKPKAVQSKLFLPKATPNKLGIHRMVIKTKTKSKTAFKPQTASTPAPPSASKKKKKSVRPKIVIGQRSKTKSKKGNTSGAQQKIVTFECDTCKKTFKSYQALNDHLVEHEFEEPFNCNFCDATFANDEYLKVHINEAHPTEGDKLVEASGEAKIESH